MFFALLLSPFCHTFLLAHSTPYTAQFFNSLYNTAVFFTCLQLDKLALMQTASVQKKYFGKSVEWEKVPLSRYPAASPNISKGAGDFRRTTPSRTRAHALTLSFLAFYFFVSVKAALVSIYPLYACISCVKFVVPLSVSKETPHIIFTGGVCT